MTNIPEPTVRATRYEVSCLPEDDINARHFTIKVESRGKGRWAVIDSMFCLSRAGEWNQEPIPSERTDAWKAAHRFDKETALRHAKEQAPLMTVNGYTVADALRRTR